MVGDLAKCLHSHKFLIGTNLWLSDKTGNSEISPGDSYVIRKKIDIQIKLSRDKEAHLLQVRSDLIITHKPDLDIDCELIWELFEFVDAKTKVTGTFYRSPTYDKEDLDMLFD